MPQPPAGYLPEPADLVTPDRKVTRAWLYVFEQFAARILASGTVLGPSSALNNGIVLFGGGTGQLLTGATGTGVVHATSGVYSVTNVSLTAEVTGVLPIANGGGLSGTYTPTLTGVANVAASTAAACQWLRVGSVVTVTGVLDLDPTAAALTQLGISLPIASNLTALGQCAGVAVAPGIAGQCAAVRGDVTNDRAQLEYVAVDLTNQPWAFSFSYQVLP